MNTYSLVSDATRKLLKEYGTANGNRLAQWIARVANTALLSSKWSAL